MNEWIESKFELPEKDGIVEVSNDKSLFIGLAMYNGYGFEFDDHYIDPVYWRECPPKVKRYGKLSNLR